MYAYILSKFCITRVILKCICSNITISKCALPKVVGNTKLTKVDIESNLGSDVKQEQPRMSSEPSLDFRSTRLVEPAQKIRQL